MENSTTFLNVPERPSFPDEEEKTLLYWRDIKAFPEAMKRSEGKEPYVFYDGPPFATGLPHYGHILAGTIKDVVTRYAYQRGYHVERRFGWDCHGLPVEYEIDKKLGLKGRPDVLKMGIDKYNEECRGIVQRYTGEWRMIVERFGRWIDFDNDYKTMDLSFMESVWWVFKQLFDKGQVYRAFRVMPYSTACSTPLSNFEVSQNYKEVSDPSIIVRFKSTSEENTWYLVWTTTPWTLPSNVALCVNPEITYLRLKNKEDGSTWVVGKDRWKWVCGSIKKDPEKNFQLIEEIKGQALVGMTYEPLFNFFVENEQLKIGKAWRILKDGYVSTEAGTCIVHQAPAFGEDDYRVCEREGIFSKDGTGLVCPIDDNGCFTAEVSLFKGQHVKEADKDIKEHLKEKGSLVFNGNEVHNYPHCWRSDTPLIYRAIASWFVKVEEIRDKLIKNNNATYWVPASVKEKRFHNWLSEARDWCVSRNRFWGTPIPLWVSSDFEEVVCVGSVAELEKISGKKITDIHRHFIDQIEIPSKQGKGMLRRVDEVFDCWFESGSMPYAQKHYPFEEKENFEKSFPAHFIAEGLDQTRGWFYTLMVLSTHLFDRPPFQNLIVNGLVLAADGKKMSKRLKNYPDPLDMCKQHGADAVRMYMCNSPVVRAEPLKFREDGVKDVVKDVFLPWYHAYRLLTQETMRYEQAAGTKFVPDDNRMKSSSNAMDKWITASVHGLIKFVREEMEAYRLYTVVPRLVQFLDDLTNWYVRLNRDRMKGKKGADDALTGLCTLYSVLLNVTVLLAPVTPFMCELLYQNLARALPEGHALKAPSVHFVMIPEADLKSVDASIMSAVSRMQDVVELGRTCRNWRKVGLKTPLKSMTFMALTQDASFLTDVKSLESYIAEELNIMELKYSEDAKDVSLSATPNFSILGKKVGKDMKAVQAAVAQLSQADLLAFEKAGVMKVCGHELSKEDVVLQRSVKNLDDPNLATNSNTEALVILDFTPDDSLAEMALAREITNKVQKLRKDAKLQLDDPVDMWVQVRTAKKSTGTLAKVLSARGDYVQELLNRPLFPGGLLKGHEVLVKQEAFDMEASGGDELVVTITVRCPVFNDKELTSLCGGDDAAVTALKQYALSYSSSALAKLCENGGVKMNLNGKKLVMKHQEHFAMSTQEAKWLAGGVGKVDASLLIDKTPAKEKFVVGPPPQVAVKGNANAGTKTSVLAALGGQAAGTTKKKKWRMELDHLHGIGLPLWGVTAGTAGASSGTAPTKVAPKAAASAPAASSGAAASAPATGSGDPVQALGEKIRERKAALKAEGKKSKEVDNDPEVKQMVAELQELKGGAAPTKAENPQPAAKPAPAAAPKAAASAPAASSGDAVQALGDKIRERKAALKAEGKKSKEVDNDPEVKQMVAELQELKKATAA